MFKIPTTVLILIGLTGCATSGTTSATPTSSAATQPEATPAAYTERNDAREAEVMGQGHISPVAPTVLPLTSFR